MGFNRKEGKPPLYRKVNKRTHNGWSWYQFSHNRYRYERGLVVNRNPNGEMSAWCCVGGEESYWSTLWVDDDGLLQFVNPDYSWIEANRDHVDEFYSGEWTISWNGKVVWPESAVKPENGV